MPVSDPNNSANQSTALRCADESWTRPDLSYAGSEVWVKPLIRTRTEISLRLYYHCLYRLSGEALRPNLWLRSQIIICSNVMICTRNCCHQRHRPRLRPRLLQTLADNRRPIGDCNAIQTDHENQSTCPHISDHCIPSASEVKNIRLSLNKFWFAFNQWFHEFEYIS